MNPLEYNPKSNSDHAARALTALLLCGLCQRPAWRPVILDLAGTPDNQLVQ